jgi:hypothetical protein
MIQFEEEAVRNDIIIIIIIIIIIVTVENQLFAKCYTGPRACVVCYVHGNEPSGGVIKS